MHVDPLMLACLKAALVLIILNVTICSIGLYIIMLKVKKMIEKAK